MHSIELILAFILCVAMACQWAAWRLRLPAILFLLIAGLVVGPVLGWVKPDELFGDMLMPMVSLSVAIILFEGSLTLNLKQITGVGKVVQRMITIGALTTWVIVACATHYILDFSWEMSALFGAITIVTGPTVIVPMLRSVRPTAKVAKILRWEGIAIDPIGALMAVLTYEFIILNANNLPLGHVFVVFLQAVLVGTVLGVFTGWALGILLAKNWVPEYLQNLATLSLVLIAFTVSNYISHESGLIAVTVMGMWLANNKDVDVHPILNFKEHLSLLLISMLFIVLAAKIDLLALLDIGWKAILLLAVVQFIARPIKVLISTIGLDVSWPERGLLAWIAPRGIVAAAISAVFADKLIAAGYDDADLLVPLTFSIIIGTVVLQSTTARFVAQWLGVKEPPARGFLMVGANAFSIALAQELAKHDLRCVIADSNWDGISQARMAGVETFFGNPISEYADTHLDLSGIGNLLAMSRQHYVNTMAAVHYKADFGDNRVFSLATRVEKNKSEKHKTSENYRGVKLFGDELFYSKIVNLVAKGGQLKSTTLSEEFKWTDYVAQNDELRIPLFHIDEKGVAHPFVSGDDSKPSDNSIIVSLNFAA